MIMASLAVDQLQTNEAFDFAKKMNRDILSPYIKLQSQCKYFEYEELSSVCSKHRNFFSLYSHNIRSLPNKWSEFTKNISSLGGDQDFGFSAVALQEIWNVPINSSFNLPGYHPLIYAIRDKSRINSNAGGGVGLYIKQKFKFELIDIECFIPHIFEAQFVKIFINPKQYIIIGNIYRPGGDINFFNITLGNILKFLNSNKNYNQSTSVYLCGDFNINILNFDQDHLINDYTQINFENKLLPRITLPTRITETTASCIDHINTNSVGTEAISGILLCKLSDHLPVFFY